MKKLIVENDTVAKWLTKFYGVSEEQPVSEGVIPPSPDQVALAIIQGMFASGKYGDTVEAVIHAAWVAVPQFYIGRHMYVTQYATLAGLGPVSDDV